MSDEKLRYPKIILDMMLFLKGNINKNSKPSFSTLIKEAEKVKLELTNSEKFLEENLKELEKNQDVYRLFLFVAQFQNGLSEQDF
jgi:hypothetical protein